MWLCPTISLWLIIVRPVRFSGNVPRNLILIDASCNTNSGVSLRFITRLGTLHRRRLDISAFVVRLCWIDRRDSGLKDLLTTTTTVQIRMIPREKFRTFHFIRPRRLVLSLSPPLFGYFEVSGHAMRLCAAASCGPFISSKWKIVDLRPCAVDGGDVHNSEFQL